jgi:hypothetical protein
MLDLPLFPFSKALSHSYQGPQGPKKEQPLNVKTKIKINRILITIFYIICLGIISKDFSCFKRIGIIGQLKTSLEKCRK